MREVITPCTFAPTFPFDPANKKKKPQTPRSPEGFPELPDDWLSEFEYFKASDGKTQLCGRLFRPKDWVGDNAHKALFILHGQGEHSGRYVHVPHYVRNQVSSVYAIDHRGHGLSKGGRGHIDDFDQYADDVELCINRYYEYLLERFGKAEIHVLAHSMGGQIMARAMIKYKDLPIKSVSLSAPMFDLAFEVPKIKVMASKIILKLAPALSIPSEPLSDLVSRDSKVCAHYKADALNHGFASSAFYYSYLDRKDDSYKNAKDIKYPTMVQVAGSDKIINPKSIETFADRLEGQHKKMVYRDMYHEIYNEPDREQAFKDLLTWIGKHSD